MGAYLAGQAVSEKWGGGGLMPPQPLLLRGSLYFTQGSPSSIILCHFLILNHSPRNSFTFDANFALVHLSHAASNRRRLCFT